MGYTARQVANAIDISPARVRTLAKAGLVEATDGKYSFLDMVLLRTAKQLVDARVPRKRIREALEKLRDRSGVKITAEGRDVVVDDGTKRWAPGSGQMHFDLGAGEEAKPIVRRAEGDRSAEEWFETACGLETEPSEAVGAYRRVLELDPTHADAHINLGRLLHDEGKTAEAERHYRAALEIDPADETAHFNLAVVLEDQERWEEALNVYEQIDHADAHYNAAVLCERLGHRAAALRHFKRYRQLNP